MCLVLVQPVFLSRVALVRSRDFKEKLLTNFYPLDPLDARRFAHWRGRRSDGSLRHCYQQEKIIHYTPSFVDPLADWNTAAFDLVMKYIFRKLEE